MKFPETKGNYLLRHVACRILVPWPEIELVLPVVEKQNPNYWNIREFPQKAN